MISNDKKEPNWNYILDDLCNIFLEFPDAPKYDYTYYDLWSMFDALYKIVLTHKNVISKNED